MGPVAGLLPEVGLPLTRDGDQPLHEVKGKIKEAAGWAAGDREAEAEGRAESSEGSEPEPGEVAAETDQVRKEHRDI